MVSSEGLWSRSVDLWVTAVLRDLRRHRTRGLLALLVTLCSRRGFSAFSRALLYCRGDRDDPLVVLLRELCSLAKFGASDRQGVGGRFSDGYKVGRRSGHLDQRQSSLKAAGTLSCCVLSAVVPLLLHVFLSRCKFQVRSQDLCHTYSAIVHDVNAYLRSVGGSPASGRLCCKRSAARLRSAPRSAGRALPIRRVGASPIDRALYRCCSLDSLLGQVDPAASARSSTIVDGVRRSAIGNAHPVDNFSGIQEILYLTANTCKLDTADSIPCSLYQLYEQLPSASGGVRSRVESALVYIQRLRSLDLEFKCSRGQMLREASREFAGLRQYLGRRVDSVSRPYRMWYRLKDKLRSRYRHYRRWTRNAPPRRAVSALGVAPSPPALHDGQVSSVVGRCLLFSSEYLCGFTRLCSSVSHTTSGSCLGGHGRLLLLASSAILRSCIDKPGASSPDLPLSAPLMAYYSFMRAVDSVCGCEFYPVTPLNLHPSRSSAVSWVTSAVLSTASNSQSLPGTFGTSVCDPNRSSSSDFGRSGVKGASSPGSESSPASPSVVGLDSSLKDSGPDASMSSLLVDRDSVVDSLSDRCGRRVYLSEDVSLCILRAQATVYKLYFDHLRGVFCQLQERFMSLHAAGKGTGPSADPGAPLDELVAQVLSGSRPLTSEDSGRSFLRVMPEYSLNAYTRLVLLKFCVRMLNEMHPRAFWLSNCQMSLLDSRVLGNVTDVYL